jgi:predicted Ser/Thr protein kinase
MTSMTATTCPRPERLLEFVDGKLDEPGQIELESHIDVCEPCRTAIAAAAAGRAPAWTLGRYRIDGVLGAGGMGVVYRGWDPALARPVAVKVVRGGDDAAELRGRLAREAQSLARLNHPNACHVYDVGLDGDELWIAMELVHGVTLRAWLGGQPTRAAVFAVLADVARGLAAAHAAGLVHRDVKPENVLVEHGGRAVVTDFGLARSVIEGDRATRTSSLAGTPAYMAPEQLDGIPADARTDQYAFGVMAHEALTGARPRPRNVASPTLPPKLRAAIGRALADQPADRFPSIPDLQAAIERATAPHRRWPYAIAAALGVASLGVLGVAMIPADSPAPAPAPIVTAPIDAHVVAPIVIAPIDAAQDVAQGSPPVDAAIHRSRPRLDAGVIAMPASAPPIEARTSTADRVAADRADRADRAKPIADEHAAEDTDRTADLSAPRFGSTRNVRNIQPKRKATLAKAESVFASGYCVMPGGAVAATWSQPIDWGKVVRVADVVGLYANKSPMDAHLLEIAGQRRHYIIDTYWGGAVNGDVAAGVGDTVALCPQDDDDRWQLPGDWKGPITHTHAAVRVGGPPDPRGLRYVSLSELVATSKDQRWPFPARVLVYARTGGKLNDGHYMMGGWELLVDSGTAHALDLSRGAWIVVESPQWEPAGNDRMMLVAHAADMRASVFPEP